MALSIRLILAILFILAGAMALIAALNYFKFESSLKELQRSRIAAIGLDLKHSMEQTTNLGLALRDLQSNQDLIERALAKDRQLLSITIFDRKGDCLFHTRRTDAHTLLDLACRPQTEEEEEAALSASSLALALHGALAEAGQTGTPPRFTSESEGAAINRFLAQGLETAFDAAVPLPPVLAIGIASVAPSSLKQAVEAQEKQGQPLPSWAVAAVQSPESLQRAARHLIPNPQWLEANRNPDRTVWDDQDTAAFIIGLPIVNPFDQAIGAVVVRYSRTAFVSQLKQMLMDLGGAAIVVVAVFGVVAAGAIFLLFYGLVRSVRRMESSLQALLRDSTRLTEAAGPAQGQEPAQGQASDAQSAQPPPATKGKETAIEKDFMLFRRKTEQALLSLAEAERTLSQH